MGLGNIVITATVYAKLITRVNEMRVLEHCHCNRSIGELSFVKAFVSTNPNIIHAIVKVNFANGTKPDDSTISVSFANVSFLPQKTLSVPVTSSQTKGDLKRIKTLQKC